MKTVLGRRLGQGNNTRDLTYAHDNNFRTRREFHDSKRGLTSRINLSKCIDCRPLSFCTKIFGNVAAGKVLHVKANICRKRTIVKVERKTKVQIRIMNEEEERGESGK